jgi:CheY-like chemotaxis protein
MSVIRILVADDHAVIRRAICSFLSNHPILDVVCQTADGEQAVLKAIRAVREGKRFVSQRIASQGWAIEAAS